MNKTEQKINKLLMEYLIATSEKIRTMAREGKGRKVLGGINNRPEDVEIEIDRVGEEILKKLLKKYSLNANIFSESTREDIKFGKDIEVYGALDPFDGSVLYVRGIEHNWYTVLSFFSKERQPIATGIADILNNKYYLTEEDGNYLIDFKTKKKTKISPSSKKTLKGDLMLASYIMSSKYSQEFFDTFLGLVRNMHPRALFYPNGGSYIYAYLAQGLIDAYVMFSEPRSEIDPGFWLAKSAGCQVVSVNSDGRFEDYEFLPGQQHDKIPLLVAASTSELRDEIINYYLAHKKN